MLDAVDRLLLLSDVKALVRLGHSAIYAGIKAGTFPRQVKIGGAARWSEAEIQNWIRERLAARAAA